MTVIETGLQVGHTPVEADVYEGYENYFGFDSTEKFHMPDGKQYIVFKPLNEGARAAFEAKTSRDVSFSRKSDDAKIKINSAEDRHELILQSVTDWFMGYPDGKGGITQVPFSTGKGGSFNQWLQKANPKIVNDLHRAIQKANSWMTADMDAEMIREEMKRLQELLNEVEQRDAAQKNS